jgi:hypothetical protein
MRELDDLTRPSLNLKLIVYDVFTSEWVSLQMERWDRDVCGDRFSEWTLGKTTERDLNLIVNKEVMRVDEALHHSFNVTIIISKFERDRESSGSDWFITRCFKSAINDENPIA